MRLLQTDCSIEYEGRCHTFLDYAVRLVMIKSDGSVLVLNDKGIKPLNYMMNVKRANKTVSDDGHETLVIEGRKECLIINMRSILQDVYLPFYDDADDMNKTGTEDELQAYVSEKLGDFIPGAVPLCREFDTGKGRVDICGLSDNGTLILVEMKRKAVRKDVYQVLRYADGIAALLETARNDNLHMIEVKGSRQTDKIGRMVEVDAFENVDLYLAASAFTKNTVEEAAEHGVGIIDVSGARRTIENEYLLRHEIVPAMTPVNG